MALTSTRDRFRKLFTVRSRHHTFAATKMRDTTTEILIGPRGELAMNNTAPLPQQKDLRHALIRERSRLRQSVGLLADAEREFAYFHGAEGGVGNDQADVAANAAEQSLDLTLERIELRRLQDVDSALQRLEQGTYGSCDRCNGPIGMDRLVVMPWTRYCIRCSQKSISGRGRSDA
jgi:RNA polymerase-binding protein DksA